MDSKDLKKNHARVYANKMSTLHQINGQKRAIFFMHHRRRHRRSQGRQLIMLGADWDTHSSLVQVGRHARGVEA